MTWLVTGGAGYIGSHVVQAFLDAGMRRSCSTTSPAGVASSCPRACRSCVGSITDSAVVADVLRDHDVEGVVHVAGYKYAGRLRARAARSATTSTSRARASCSSSASRPACARSSSPPRPPSSARPTSTSSPRTPPKAPESPYGESKLIGEWLLRDTARAAEQLGEPPFRHTSLRYFNVVGSGIPTVYDVSPHNLFPLVLAAVTDGRRPTVFGDDYATPDGSCVRDYIHVSDVASAHVAAARALAAGEPLARGVQPRTGRGALGQGDHRRGRRRPSAARCPTTSAPAAPATPTAS